MSSNQCTSNCASDKNWCNTETEVDEVSFSWTIRYFDFHEAKGDALRSSIFSAPTNDKFKWHLLCKPNGITLNKDTISIFLYLSADVIERVFAKYTISIFDERREMDVREYRATTSSSGWQEFLKKNQNFRSKLSANNELTIHCNLKFAEMKNIQNCFQQYKPKLSACNLSEDLALLFENQDFSDVILSVKGKNFQAHKIILAARSPVFAAMFKHKMKESEQNRVVIEDMNEDTMQEILRYIYTGKCQNLNKLAEELLAAADKYELDRLKMICMESLTRTVSVENAGNLLVLADLHGVNELKVEVIKFIVANFTVVSNTTGWKNISNLQLIREVCQALARR